MGIPEILAIMVVAIAAPLNWFVAWRLWYLSHLDPKVWTLRSAAISATGIAVIVTVFALVFLNNGQPFPPLDAFETQLITRTTLLILSTVPAIYWLRRYKKD